MLLDSNIVIYAARPEHADLRRFIAEQAPAVSAISYVETLGYHRLTEQEREFLIRFFQLTPTLALSDVVLERAVQLRQRRPMQLGDALIAGTALVHGLTLVTRNTRDFAWIGELRLLDPLAGR
jgi:toxin FitB